MDLNTLTTAELERYAYVHAETPLELAASSRLGELVVLDDLADILSKYDLPADDPAQIDRDLSALYEQIERLENRIADLTDEMENLRG